VASASEVSDEEKRAQPPRKRISDVNEFVGDPQKMRLSELMDDIETREELVKSLKRQEAKKVIQNGESGPVQTAEKAQNVEQKASEEKQESSDSEEEAGGIVAPQLTFDDEGNIIVNEESLMVTAGAETEVDPRPTIEVDPNAYVNSMTYMKREKSRRWSRPETDLFFEAVQQCGTDFMTMEHLLPGRSRKQIKLKFNREERDNPTRLANAMYDRLPFDDKILKKLEKDVKARAAKDAADAADNHKPGGEAERQAGSRENLRESGGGIRSPPDARDNEGADYQEVQAPERAKDATSQEGHDLVLEPVTQERHRNIGEPSIEQGDEQNESDRGSDTQEKKRSKVETPIEGKHADEVGNHKSGGRVAGLERAEDITQSSCVVNNIMSSEEGAKTVIRQVQFR